MASPTSPAPSWSRPDLSAMAEHEYHDLDMLRLTTAGSVDDGKSTLIGRLLYDTKSILEDQLEAVQRASEARGDDHVNLALLTDGLRAEREQNITIDVAYRYFATPNRKFIIADTPGHVQYTRNMVTGASLAELAIVLVDARKGVQTQSKRHGFIASLLRIPHLVVAVNKMDLVDFDEGTFRQIVQEYGSFAEQLGVTPEFIPVSALLGDNVVERSENTPWYSGPTLLEKLESAEIGLATDEAPFRLPIQYVIRPHQDFRGFAGRVASGHIEQGAEVTILPGRQTSRIRSIESADGTLPDAMAGESVVLQLEDEVDVSRGDLIVPANDIPEAGTRIESLLSWMSEEPLDTSVNYVLMHASRQLPARVRSVIHLIDVDTLDRHPASELGLNDIGRVHLEASQPIYFDRYEQNRGHGNFILIHPHTNSTVAAGMFLGLTDDAPGDPASVSPNVVWEEWNVPRSEREARNGHGAALVWLTGLSGSGKSTVAREVERRLFDAGARTMLLDGDQVRHGLCGDLGFSDADRTENLRRVAEAARLFFESGDLVLASFVSPRAVDRERVASLFPADRFVEVFVDAPVDVCRERDPKGLYAKADAGEIQNFTGVSAPYEAPARPALTLATRDLSVAEAAQQVIALLAERGIIPETLAAAARGER